MRIIKFRAWHKINKIMYNVDYIDFKNDCRSVGLTKPTETARSDDNRDLELMQFIGLKDIDNIDLFEGDIVLFPENKKIHIIYYYQSGFVLKTINENIVVYSINSKFIKKIGNIYENPELL